MINHGYYLLKLLRPRQWIKNFALFAGITFAGQLFTPDILSKVVSGFIAFCFLSSATYIFNDILDVKKDRLHPFKRLRPIASGKISVAEAIIVLILFFILAMIVAISTGWLFTLVAIAYLLLQVLYSTVFKQITIFDMGSANL